LLAGLLGVLALSAARGDAQTGKAPTADSKPAAKKTEAPAKLPLGVVSTEAWLKASRAPLKAGEIDTLLDRELEQVKIKPALLTTDEQFLRRVMLDLTGHLPMPADVKDFVADKDPNKRAKLIDKLLDSEEYARHWARYWREVISSRLTDFIGLLTARQFEQWLTEQIQKDAKWGDITRAMITASGQLRNDGKEANGAAFLLGSRRGSDATVERAAETSRIFLGIQIQCAQCHDHPSDVWKRVQFHELAAYFARLKERPLRENNKLVGLELISLPKFEYRMPGKDDPRQGTTMQPRFLTGKAPGAGLSDLERRRSLADSVVDKNNPWFAAAYVNRIWGELMGQSFYQPVDDLGPQKEAVLPNVLARVAGAFRGSDYDTKALFRAVLNSKMYQRQIRPGEADDHLLFAAAYPARMRADSLWQSLVDVLGRMGGGPGMGARPGGGPFAFQQGLEGAFKAEFGFDPSMKSDEVEGSIPQALLLMNNPVINQKIQAKGTNLLARILESYPKNEDALRMVYLRALGRRPTEREQTRCLQYIGRVGNRAEAFEDILWALINSTEFQTKR
jgi:hypothetical protein